MATSARKLRRTEMNRSSQPFKLLPLIARFTRKILTRHVRNSYVSGLELTQFNLLKLTSARSENSPIFVTNCFDHHPKIANFEINI